MPEPPDETFRRWAEQATGDAPLDQALAALHRIATSAGIFEKTWQAVSIAEVGEILAAWCYARRPGLNRPSAGVVELTASEPISAGSEVETHAVRDLARLARGGGYYLGRALNDAAAGDLIYIRLGSQGGP
jgi:hypothetical protein